MTVKEITDAINLRLLECRKDFTVYVDFQPQEVKRPAFALEYIRCTGRKRMTCGTYMSTELFQITYFAPTDSYYRPDRMGLYDVTEDVLKEFDNGYIKVADRAPKINAYMAEVSGTEAFTEITVERTERTGEAERKRKAEEEAEKMGVVELDIKSRNV